MKKIIIVVSVAVILTFMACKHGAGLVGSVKHLELHNTDSVYLINGTAFEGSDWIAVSDTIVFVKTKK